ncbi:TPA: cell division protein FtsK [Streptococcus equi subsp. zooepidemicus]|nr:cell division protein FtsK [Streptococcus equi subsp. zooepidemicus]HEL0429290.1 cell division protein FtsK [Streptococcus equi subsp. zooepidemicus]HEL0431425.1 cell division protein FtsK [Streptococcus equi subsp. zooepidemicus]HEL0435550.1 cell division protein FtsK [Streptococcus equi subsp. zooepidemicus]HEL0439662.1 cell division protein FtsK [Streptococcus equi subsp. zooepidemicus]
MPFLISKNQGQKVSGEQSPDTTSLGKNRYLLEQFLRQNLNNALDINNESSYLNSFDIRVLSNDSGFLFIPNLPVSYAMDSKLYLLIFAICAGILYPYKTLLPQNNAYFVPYDENNPSLARAFFFPWLDGVPTRLKINDLNNFIKTNTSETSLPIMSNGINLDTNKVVHTAISGASGSGKTHFVRYLILCLKSLDNTIICIDPKLSDIYLLAKELGLEVFAPTKGANLNSFITEINELLGRIINKIYERQEILLTKPDKKFKRIYIVIDELLALVQGSSKQARETFAQLLGTIALLGRQTNISLILLSQRFDATAFGGNTAVREQLNCIIILGEINANTCQFLLPNTNVDNIVVPAGIGTGIIKFTDSNHQTLIMPLLTPTYSI